MSKDNDSMKVEMKSFDLQIRKLSTKMDHVESIAIDSFEDMAAHVDYLQKSIQKNKYKDFRSS